MLVNRVSRCDLLFYMVRVDLVIPNSRDLEKTIPGIREWSCPGKSRDSGIPGIQGLIEYPFEKPSNSIAMSVIQIKCPAVLESTTCF